jgi:glycosyltransferase involved in cell wall biosynthesis
VGKKGWQYDEILASGKDTSNIYFTGYVRDADLHVLYSGAQAFCYISHYEGFGLPLLEAMSCRTPVICGHNSSQIELIAQNGMAVDSNDVEAIYTAMTTLLNDDLRESYAAMAWKKSFEYTWYKTAKQTIAFYKKIIDKLPTTAHQPLR